MESAAGEQVFFHGHPSWRSILGYYIKGLLIAILAGVIAGVVTRITDRSVQAGWVALVVGVMFVIILVGGLLRRIQTTYTISSQRLTIHTGILSKELHETRLERVQNVNYRQSLLQRMLGIGTVTFDTAGEAGYDFAFHGVSHPHQIVRTVDRAIHEFQQQRPSGV